MIKNILYSHYSYEFHDGTDHTLRITFDSGRTTIFKVPQRSAVTAFEKIRKAVNEEYELLHTKEVEKDDRGHTS